MCLSSGLGAEGSPKRTLEGMQKGLQDGLEGLDELAARNVQQVESLCARPQAMPVPSRTRRRSFRPESTGGIAALPTPGASREFLESLFAKHNIDGEQVTSKEKVEKELRHTLGAPQNEHMVEAVSCAVMSHVEASLGQYTTVHGNFDERRKPLTEGADSLPASVAEVKQWLWTILDALMLEPECLIISLVLLERAVVKSTLQLTPFTWRPCVLCSLVIASKTWYDKAIFNVDFSDRLPGYDLTHLNVLETDFLNVLDYRATVSMSLYAKYFFALQDVINGTNGAGSNRRSTWSPGDLGQ